MPRFTVLDSAHVDDKGKTYRRGETLESPHDLDRMFNKPGYPPKFQRDHEHEKVEASMPAAGTFVFNPSAESFEQFQERVKAAQKPNTSPSAPTSPPPPQPPRNLEAMSEQDLRKLAEAEEIDLKGAKGKQEMIKVLKAAGF